MKYLSNSRPQASVCWGGLYKALHLGDRMDDEISVNVILASGRGTCLSVLPSSSIGELKAAAAQEFGQGFLKLLTADCRLGAAFMSLFKLFIWMFPKMGFPPNHPFID